MDTWGGLFKELGDEIEGEGDVVRVGEVGRLISLGKLVCLIGEAGKE